VGGVRVAGADIWKRQWVVVVLHDGRYESIHLAPTIEAVLDVCADARVVGLDVPIGLPPPGERRQSDEAVRRFVGPRRRSLFATPPLELLEASSLADANRLAVARGWPGISAQTYGLRHAILEVQPLAARDERLFEVFPEASFVRANGDVHLAASKLSWNGVELRRGILCAQGIVLPSDLGRSGHAGVADVLDAAAVAWSAWRIATGRGEPIPPGAARLAAVWV
jgi:predicted RNase H-like nuclease